MTIGTTLALLSIVAPVAAYLLRRHALRPGGEPLVFILACLASYGLLLASLPFREAEIKAHMYSFDLDRNGSFDEAESTPEAKAAMHQWSSDTGRNFAPFTGMFLAPIWSAVVYAFLSVTYCFVNGLLKLLTSG